MLARHCSECQAGRMTSRPTLDTGQHPKQNPSTCLPKPQVGRIHSRPTWHCVQHSGRIPVICWPKCQVGRIAARPAYGSCQFADALAVGSTPRQMNQCPGCAPTSARASRCPSAQRFTAPSDYRFAASRHPDMRERLHDRKPLRPSMGFQHTPHSEPPHADIQTCINVCTTTTSCTSASVCDTLRPLLHRIRPGRLPQRALRAERQEPVRRDPRRSTAMHPRPRRHRDVHQQQGIRRLRQGDRHRQKWH